MQEPLIRAVAQVAEAWRDPDYPPRARAEAKTLEADNRFTDEALAFAVNHRMHQWTEEKLSAWIGGRWAEAARDVGLIDYRRTPGAMWEDALAVVLTGHRLHGLLPAHSPVLLPAFFAEVEEVVPALKIDWQEDVAGLETVDTLLVSERRDAEDEEAIPNVPHVLYRPSTYAVAVLTGGEQAEEQDGLAEDALLFDGHGSRSAQVVWAPRDCDADPYFQAFAEFRSVFRIDPRVAGTLRMQRALLEAQNVPHAFGDGFEFLVSRAAPTPQAPGHLRWAVYDSLEQVEAWLAAEASTLQAVVCSPRLTLEVPPAVERLPFGEAHRPEVGWTPKGPDLLAHLFPPPLDVGL